MEALINRVQALCGGDTVITDDDYGQLLDDHAFDIECALEPRPPFFVQHRSPFENIEAGAVVYVGYNTLLTEDTDYTIDLQRGIVTTPSANYQVIRLQGTAYDINAAAADGWERIAARYVGEFDIASPDGSLKLSQQYDHALGQAAKYRAKAWATTTTVDRADTPGQTHANQLLDSFRQVFR